VISRASPASCLNRCSCDRALKCCVQHPATTRSGRSAKLRLLENRQFAIDYVVASGAHYDREESMMRESVIVFCVKPAAAMLLGATLFASSRAQAMPLALLWQIYSRHCSLQINFRQCGHRCGGGRAMNSRMGWRTAGK